MVFKFKGTDRVGNPFNGVRYGMGEVVHRVNAPFVTCAVMMGMDDAVQDRIAHIEVRAGHVDLSTQYFFAVAVLAFLHFGKELQVFFDAAAAVRAFLARRAEGTAVFADFIA